MIKSYYLWETMFFDSLADAIRYYHAPTDSVGTLSELQEWLRITACDMCYPELTYLD